jgi:hypothetical protein
VIHSSNTAQFSVGELVKIKQCSMKKYINKCGCIQRVNHYHHQYTQTTFISYTIKLFDFEDSPTLAVECLEVLA